MSDRILKRETLCQASRFRVDRVEYVLLDGRVARREVIEHPGAVVIVPVLDDGRICLIHSYRIAVQKKLIELPAGTLEPGEPPERTAFRELIEETGYRAGEMRSMLQLLMSPGILHERMHVFLAQRLTAGDPEREVGEEIENLLLEPEQVRRMIWQNEITDSKTVSALLYYLHFQTELNGSV